MSTRIIWDEVGKRFFETGVDRGVLYVQDDTGAYGTGVAWNGLVNVTEKPSGAEASPLYADNIKYLNLYSKEDYAASIEAYTTPDEFAACDGTAEIATGVTIGQQARKSFGFAYRTKIGNDIVGDKYSYKIHIVYGCKAAPTEKAHATVNESPEAMTLSYELTTTPVVLDGFDPTSCVTIDTTKLSTEKLTALENKLYGSETATATLPTLAELVELIGTESIG